MQDMLTDSGIECFVLFAHKHMHTHTHTHHSIGHFPCGFVVLK